jgi:hypothetical protein
MGTAPVAMAAACREATGTTRVFGPVLNVHRPGSLRVMQCRPRPDEGALPLLARPAAAQRCGSVRPRIAVGTSRPRHRSRLRSCQHRSDGRAFPLLSASGNPQYAGPSRHEPYRSLCKGRGIRVSSLGDLVPSCPDFDRAPAALSALPGARDVCLWLLTLLLRQHWILERTKEVPRVCL